METKIYLLHVILYTFLLIIGIALILFLNRPMDDNTILKETKYKGERAKNVPDSYFRFIYEEKKKMSKGLKKYIEDKFYNTIP